MRKALILILLLASSLVFAAFEPETGVVTNERWKSGVPLGGVGCG